MKSGNTSACRAELSHQPSPLAGEPEVVDVWIVFLPALAASFTSLVTLLSEEERSRARRFRHFADTRRYVLSHAALRLLLARYCRQQPSGLRFASGPWGKPRLDGLASPEMMHFNLSHSVDFAAVAVCHSGPVGVDIERVIEDYNPEDAIRLISPGEAASLRAMPETLRRSALFRCWTRKEAYLKARGDGLFFDLSRFEVSLDDPPPPQWLRVDGQEAESGRWRLFSPPPPAGYATAVVAVDQVRRIRLMRWDG